MLPPAPQAITVNVGGHRRSFSPARVASDVFWYAALAVLVRLLLWAIGLWLTHQGPSHNVLAVFIERISRWEPGIVGQLLAATKGANE